MLDALVLSDTAEIAARRAGAMLREKWSHPRQLTSKGYRDIVTDSDFASQQIIATTILSRFPDHGLLAEEEDSELPDKGPVIWIVDPIDGTTNFSREIPAFCISIGAMIDGEVVAGVVYDPLRDELFHAARGHGAYLNSKPITVSAVAGKEAAIWGVDFARTQADRQRLFDAILRYGHEVRSIRGIGAAALGLAWLAAGRIDIYLNFTLSAWDVAAGHLLIEEAGGTITCTDGSAWSLTNSQQGILASNGQSHERLRQQINP